MQATTSKSTKVYLLAMGIFYLIFGLITIFYPKLMQMFQTPIGVSANTSFSDNIWIHEGFDILSVTLLLIVLAGYAVTPRILRVIALVAMMPAIAIIYSYVDTPFWSMLFFVPMVSCLGFAVWGFILAGRIKE